MVDLMINGTNTLPTVSFKTNGELKITGRALPEDAARFFAPLHEWITNFSAEEINLEINLDYFNTNVSKQLLDFFKIIERNQANKVIKLKWMYEDGDDEMLESGEIYQELLPSFSFVFNKYTEIPN